MADYTNVYLDREMCKYKAGYYDHFLEELDQIDHGTPIAAGNVKGPSIAEVLDLPRVCIILLATIERDIVDLWRHRCL